MITTEPQGENLLENDEYVMVKAKVVRRNEREDSVVTVKLVDGFGNAECVVHKDFTSPAK